MPSEVIMKKFRSGKLHSGPKKDGKRRKIVRNPKQAKAILLSTLRKEGKISEREDQPKKHSRKRIASKG